jgi:hypothetical protein
VRYKLRNGWNEEYETSCQQYFKFSLLTAKKEKDERKDGKFN